MIKNADNLILLPNSIYSNQIVERAERLYPGRNEYIVLVKYKVAKNYITSSLINFVQFNEYNYKKLRNTAFKRIIVNLHDEVSAAFLKGYKDRFPDCKLIWILWGADLYYLPYFIKRIGNNYTQPFIDEKHPWSYIKKSKELIKYLMGRINSVTLLKSYQYFDAIATIIKEDYYKAEECFDKKFQYIMYSHLSISQMYDIEDVIENSPDNRILVGNSGDPANNHDEIFSKLANFNLGRKVICPLSYGYGPYIDAIKILGRKLLKDDFVPITAFLQPKEYYNELKKCSHAVLNHNVQKAYGNIIGLLWNGAKVFLNRHNTIYSHLKNLGVHVYSIEKDFNIFELSEKLPKEYAKQNRTILKDFFSDASVDSYYRNLIEF